MQVHRTRRKGSAERGVALVAAVLFTTLVLALGTALLTMSTQELRSTEEQGQGIRLRNTAEAGIDRAFHLLKEDPTRGAAAATLFAATPLTATVDGKSVSLGEYTVRVDPGTGGGAVLTSTAYYPSASAANRLEKTIRVTAYQLATSGPLAQGMFGKNRVQINGNVNTDSYNSENGPYNAQIPGKKGTVRTNASNANAITLNGNSEVNGSVIYGPGTDVSRVRYNGNVRIDDGDGNPSNNIRAADSPMNLPPVTAPTDTTPLGEPLGLGRTKTINWNGNKNVVLNGDGKYEADNININGNADFVVNGDVTLVVNNNINWNGNVDVVVNGSLTIYAKQNFNMNGNVKNNQNNLGYQRPKNFIVYGTPSCGVVHLNGNAMLVGVVYAPNANVTFNGNAGAYGAVVGDSIDLNGNVRFHYDESLGNLMGGADGRYRIKSWSER